MKAHALLAIVSLRFLGAASLEAGSLAVVATTEDLASITREVGGDRVRVTAMARGFQDPHFVEAKPSFIFALNKADLLILVGRELEVGWLPPLVTQSRNPRIQTNASGYLDASLTAKILEIPQGQITRAMGDVHPQGNPHYWLDPGNGRRIAEAVRHKLTALSPGDADYFAARYADFDRRLGEAEQRWDATMAPFKGTKIVTYHRSWPNLCERFGLEVMGYVEPKPGIPPSPAHTIALQGEIKRLGVKVILVEPYFDLKTPNAIGRETGARVVVLAPSVGAEKEITDYIKLFDYNVNLMVSAIKQTGGR
ncbi:MAG TPA: metal ABC transporter substrate-binding protein [Vicinamibacteria bacterium]|nr:metal ABC transporter substrate-binding protein [Vicinamibacteria bacterium]